MSEAYVQKIRKILMDNLKGFHDDHTVDVDIKFSVREGKRKSLMFDVVAFDKDGTVICTHDYELRLSPGDSFTVSGFRMPLDVRRL